MKYLSVCSGIEAATVAWHPLGWKAFAYSEIEKYPCDLLKHQYPNTPNFGDMTKFKEWPHATIDVLVGGTPCQSFSVAGLRKGLDDPRGNLMLTYLAIADRYRPEWLVWENVPGVLSSNGGRDFGAFLGGLGQLGYGFAYRVLDAQYFGVPQRRRRVFVIGCLGSWQCAAAVLFEQHSLQGHPAPRREKGQEVTETAGTLAANGGGLNRPAGNTNELDFCVVAPQVASGKETIGTLMAAAGTKQWLGNQEALSGDYHILQPISAIAENIIGRKPENGGNGDGFSQDLSYTLNATGVHGVCAPVAYAFDSLASNSMKSSNPISGCNEVSISKTIDTSGLNPTCNQGGNAVLHKMAVRRLTPLECERLQGFSDFYTKINDKTTDAPRYKALGNSMAVPVMRWIGERIQLVNQIKLPA